ncbi:MBL fold metallo-hydrolase [Desulfolutivibrio sp.]|uniref:MBL fold metallo-hydrolase n=1 Tax=Desulfolutivibrio sp. TaxID=2773296 RepID=UPI002F96459B
MGAHPILHDRLPASSPGLCIAVLADNAARPGFCAEHGLSLGIVLPDGGLWLWDTGQGGIFLENARRLGIFPETARGVALSHGHYDHAGGLEYLLRRPGFRGEIVAHPAFAIPHYRRADSAFACDIGCHCPPHLLTGRPLRVAHSLARLDAGLHLLASIPRKRGNRQAISGMFLDADGQWPDIIPDDACLVHRQGETLTVILGCCHSGIANTLDAVREHFGDGPISLVLGGLHLAGEDRQTILDALDALTGHGVWALCPGHCTGEAATALLHEHFPGPVIPLAAGMIIEHAGDAP